MTELSLPHCVLLAVQLATEANIDALSALLYQRRDVLPPELAFQILLSYLPESLDAALYVNLIDVIASGAFPEHLAHTAIDISQVSSLSAGQAQKHCRHLRLLPLGRSGVDSQEPLTLFLIQRAHRIDASTGLLTTVPQLLEPFLDRSDTLKIWFTSTVLPLLRLGYEYYPQDDAAPSLKLFEELRGAQGVEALLSKTTELPKDSDESLPARDLRGLVGPWMEGSNKRRKLNDSSKRPTSTAPGITQVPAFEGTNRDNFLQHDWDYVFRWLVHQSATHFPVVAKAIEGWEGVNDVDLAGYAQQELKPEIKRMLDLGYWQAAYAAVYTVESDTAETIEGAHSLLCRIATLCGFEPPPELATSMELLPRLDAHASDLENTTTDMLLPEALLNHNHPLTTPKLETFSLLQLFVYSTYLLAGLNKPLSIRSVAKQRVHSDAQEQTTLLQDVLRKAAAGHKKSNEAWIGIRRTLLWLWDWGMDDDGTAQYGTGIFGRIDRAAFESEILKTLLANSMFDLIKQLYIGGDASQYRLSQEEVEEIIISAAMNLYDNANSCNRYHGGLQKASIMIIAFSDSPLPSAAYQRMNALLSATHALSSYSLVLQHGVPFRPVNIRVSSDPIGLIPKILSQNKNAYVELDHFISIGRNLVAAGLPQTQNAATVSGIQAERPETPIEELITPIIEPSLKQLEGLKALAERRVIAMAIRAALAEDDFETAYSYVINRLQPASTGRSVSHPVLSLEDKEAHKQSRIRRREDPQITLMLMDDFSWRAAFDTGRYRPSNNLSSSTSSLTKGSRELRHTRQRMELLSQALLLAPESHLPEILTAWRRCEEEMTSLLAREEAAEEQHADRGDRRVPGGFGGLDEERLYSLPQTRREMGRSAREEAPLGLFDVAKGAAAALGRTAFPLRGADTSTTMTTSGAPSRSSTEETREYAAQGLDGEGRMRKRDLLFNATSGATDALAGGIGWVLGAKPVRRDEGQ